MGQRSSAVEFIGSESVHYEVAAFNQIVTRGFVVVRTIKIYSCVISREPHLLTSKPNISNLYAAILPNDFKDSLTFTHSFPRNIQSTMMLINFSYQAAALKHIPARKIVNTRMLK